jgi:hypothetical protein
VHIERRTSHGANHAEPDGDAACSYSYPNRKVNTNARTNTDTRANGDTNARTDGDTNTSTPHSGTRTSLLGAAAPGQTL